MDIKYYNERHINYMVVKKESEAPDLEYQKKMLEIRKPSGLLEFNIRNLDGEEFYYYDITSRITLRQLYGSHMLGIEELKNLFFSLKTVCEETEQYLLESDRVVLNPDYIFYSLGSKKYTFTYNLTSDYIFGENSGMDMLLDYLLERVSPDDEKATEYVYSMYEYSEKRHFDIWDALELLPDDEEFDADKAQELKNILSAEEKIPDIVREESYPDNADKDYDGLTRMGEEADAVNEKKGRAGILYIVMACLGLAGIAACIVISVFMLLNDNEKIVLVSGMAAFAVLVICSIVLLFRLNKSNSKNKTEDAMLKGYVDDEWENFVQAPRNIHMKDFTADSIKMTDRKNRIKRYDSDSGEDCREVSEESLNGQTVYFEADPSSESYKLYSLDRKNKNHIELAKFPCVIGKMRDYVDCVIDHPSISRIHAKIDIKDNELILADLNSTNGVYLNGIRLRPNETSVIEPGDEIRIGSLNYCLRNCI